MNTETMKLVGHLKLIKNGNTTTKFENKLFGLVFWFAFLKSSFL